MPIDISSKALYGTPDQVAVVFLSSDAAVCYISIQFASEKLVVRSKVQQLPNLSFTI